MTENDQEIRIEELLSQLSLEEKAGLCSGANFWNLKGVERLEIPSVMVTDGPHGLRKQAGNSDHVGLNDSEPATCFPTASALASSWDTTLIEEVGRALGEECIKEDVAVLLGPGANIKRHPLCGRNFEYFSEDPFQSAAMASALVQGVQSKGIGTSLKHFAANNQETLRMTVDAVIDDRALREIYLPGFETVVKEAQPHTVMCAYNKINGEYCSENQWLLTDVLKKEWGHKGLVVTDWGANNERVKGLSAGQELEMPSSGGLNDRKIVEAVRNGDLDEKVLDQSVRLILNMILRNSAVLESGDKSVCDMEYHHQLARKAEVSSAVLLKNDGILPLAERITIAVIGAFAETPRYQGSGSSLINPFRLEAALDAMKIRFGSGNVSYAPGYDLSSTVPDVNLISEAAELAAEADVVVLFVGLPDITESEGFDRNTLDMPASHNDLINAVSAANREIVVVLSNGAPISMPWLGNVKAVLEGYLGGQSWGPAMADLLSGDVSPSGKLAETFPISLQKDPADPNFPGGTQSVYYAESLYIGYRYYDASREEVLFPFGYGLSYTTFEYSDLKVEDPDDDLNTRISYTIRNTGGTAGAEISQVYIQDLESTAFRPVKELKGFRKTYLNAGEESRVTVELNRRSYAFWDSGKGDWVVEAGDFSYGFSREDSQALIEPTLPYRKRLVSTKSHCATSIGLTSINRSAIPAEG